MATNFRLFSIFVLVVVWQANAVPLFSQQPDFIDGKVSDSVNHNPVPFATILLKYNQLGVYANAEGDFKVVNDPEFQSDSLIVTCIGFKRYSVAVKDLNLNGLNQISLMPFIYGLSEVKVTASARKLGSIAIIGRAIKNIPRNYPQNPFNYISYYRDYQKLNGNYLNLNEGIVQVLDGGFGSVSAANNYRLLDFRKNKDFRRMEISPYYDLNETEADNDPEKTIPEAKLGDQYGNELFVLMVHDAVRNFNTRSFSFIENFSENFIFNHNFDKPIPVYDNNKMLYKIIFNGKSKIVGDSLAVNGAIYIQPKSYAIYKIEYSCSYQANGKTNGEMFNIDIEYGRENSVDSLMCLKYISFNNFFKVKDVIDSSYFRILHANLDTIHFINPTIIVAFNNKIDPESVDKKGNYDISIGKKRVSISSIQTTDKKLFIRIKKDDFKGKEDSCYLNIHNIKDISGNSLNRRRSLDLYQFRELFVQEYNKPIALTDSCYLKYLPLEKNCISKYSGKEKYWMNTPQNIKIISK